MFSQIEPILQQAIFPDLQKGRKDFDLPHTQAVVFYAKKFLPTLPHLKPKIHIPAAYAHDWGYIGLFDGLNSNNLQVISKKKILHMQIGSDKIAKLLKNKLSDFYSQKEIGEVAHLVFMHDKIEELKTEDEIFIAECDTLGMLDTDRVKPSFSKEDNAKFITEQIYNRRLKIFIHKELKSLAEKLVKGREKYYQKI